MFCVERGYNATKREVDSQYFLIKMAYVNTGFNATNKQVQSKHLY